MKHALKVFSVRWTFFPVSTMASLLPMVEVYQEIVPKSQHDKNTAKSLGVSLIGKRRLPPGLEAMRTCPWFKLHTFARFPLMLSDPGKTHVA